MAAISDLRHSYRGLTAELIAGPLFQDWRRLQPTNGTVVIPFEPDLPSRFAYADLVICQAGYNTVAELEIIGTKTLLVPAARRWDDQIARAVGVSREHNNSRVLNGNNATDLAHQAALFLRAPISVSQERAADGAAKAAALIYKMLK